MCWALSLPLILSLTDIGAVADTALIIFIGILLLSAMRLRLQSVIILLALLLIGWFILPAWPSVDQLRNAGAFVLIFACLLPTLTLVRATALTMPSVMETQRQLGQLLLMYWVEPLHW